MSSKSATDSANLPSDPGHWSWRKWWIWAVVVALGWGGGWWIWGRGQSRSDSAIATAAPTVVSTETVQADSVAVSSEFVGALEAQERVQLRPEVAGQITQIFVTSGEQVAAGTPILQLSPEQPQARFRGALADTEVAKASRRAAQAALLEAEAERDSAAADKALQDSEYERIQALVAAGALPQQALDRVSRDRNVAIAALRAAERHVQTVQANLEEATATLQQVESNADLAAADLSDYQVVAPIDGVVGDMPVKVGDYVNTGQPLTTLTRNQTMELRLSIPVARSGDLRRGLPVELRTEAEREPLVIGRISFVAERVDAGAQSILAKAVFPNPNGELRDEQFVRATVIWAETPGVLIPTAAITRTGGQSFVFVMEPAEDAESDYIAVQRPIQLGGITDNRYQVTQGLTVGETLITDGILRLSDGAPVTPASSSPPASQS